MRPWPEEPKGLLSNLYMKTLGGFLVENEMPKMASFLNAGRGLERSQLDFVREGSARREVRDAGKGRLEDRAQCFAREERLMSGDNRIRERHEALNHIIRDNGAR